MCVQDPIDVSEMPGTTDPIRRPDVRDLRHDGSRLRRWGVKFSGAPDSRILPRRTLRAPDQAPAIMSGPAEMSGARALAAAQRHAWSAAEGGH